MKLARMMLAAVCVAGASQSSAASQLQTAVLAGGCYWGVESVYEHVKGVRDVVSGYAGGNASGLTRSQSDGRGRAEAVRIRFDPAQISYAQLLQIFFEVAHDPTQVDRQGPDVGPQYRSAIFPQDSGQRAAAERALTQLKASGRYPRRIATRIESGGFEIAEPAEQDFVRRHPNVRYVVVNDLPKLAELKRKYPQFWRD